MQIFDLLALLLDNVNYLVPHKTTNHEQELDALHRLGAYVHFRCYRISIRHRQSCALPEPLRE